MGTVKPLRGRYGVIRQMLADSVTEFNKMRMNHDVSFHIRALPAL